MICCNAADKADQGLNKNTIKNLKLDMRRLSRLLGKKNGLRLLELEPGSMEKRYESLCRVGRTGDDSFWKFVARHHISVICLVVLTNIAIITFLAVWYALTPKNTLKWQVLQILLILAPFLSLYGIGIPWSQLEQLRTVHDIHCLQTDIIGVLKQHSDSTKALQQTAGLFFEYPEVTALLNELSAIDDARNSKDKVMGRSNASRRLRRLAYAVKFLRWFAHQRYVAGGGKILNIASFMSASPPEALLSSMGNWAFYTDTLISHQNLEPLRLAITTVFAGKNDDQQRFWHTIETRMGLAEDAPYFQSLGDVFKGDFELRLRILTLILMSNITPYMALTSPELSHIKEFISGCKKYRYCELKRIHDDVLEGNGTQIRFNEMKARVIKASRPAFWEEFKAAQRARGKRCPMKKPVESDDGGMEEAKQGCQLVESHVAETVGLDALPPPLFFTTKPLWVGPASLAEWLEGDRSASALQLIAFDQQWAVARY